MKKEEWLGKAGPEFRPWLLFPKILTRSLFYPNFLSGMSRCGILAASPFKLQLWEFACWLWQEWWRGAPAPWLCRVVCYRLCEIAWLSVWVCSQQRVLRSKYSPVFAVFWIQSRMAFEYVESNTKKCSDASFVFLKGTMFLNWDPRLLKKKKVDMLYVTFTNALEIFV